MTAKPFWRSDLAFAIACALLYAVAVLAVPPYNPLLDVDSDSYITFEPLRAALYPLFLHALMALGLDFVRITWVQLAVFAVALVYFLTVLARSGFSRWLLALLVAAMAANVLFSSFHRSILSESLYFSLTLVLVGLWIDYLRTGGVRYLVWAGAAIGLMIGVRPVAICVLPMQALAVWVRPPLSRSALAAFGLSLLPVVVCVAGERLVYHAVHGNFFVPQSSNLLIGKAAMLAHPDMQFSGPHARTLADLARQFYDTYEPAREALADAPSFAVRVQLTAYYEGLAQFDLLYPEIEAAAKRENMSVAALRSEFGKQAILRNLSGYLGLTAVHEFGLWSVAAQRFPPTARALASYADSNPNVSFGGRLPAKLLHPSPTTVGLIVYPAFLVAGAVTFLLALGFLIFLARPSLAASPQRFYLLVATYLSAMCHGYTLFIALSNVWTPRFLMAVFPQIEIVGLCLLLLVSRRFRKVEAYAG